MESATFDVVANVPPGATRDQANLMLQNLLADRFQLKVHRSTREPPVYALVVARNGPKLKVSVDDPDAPKPRGTLWSGGRKTRPFLGSPPDPQVPELFTALTEHLGLRLEPTRGPVVVLIVDSALRQPTEM